MNMSTKVDVFIYKQTSFIFTYRAPPLVRKQPTVTNLMLLFVGWVFQMSSSLFSLGGSPELRKGNVSNLSLSPSGPGAAVPRSNRDVPLPDSGRRGKRDCIACETKKTVGVLGETNQ